MCDSVGRVFAYRARSTKIHLQHLQRGKKNPKIALCPYKTKLLPQTFDFYNAGTAVKRGGTGAGGDINESFGTIT